METKITDFRIIRDDRRPFHQVYDFIFDRLRCVRQEIVIADLQQRETVELLEPMIIFMAYSLYELCDEDISKFDPKICGQHLQECLKKVLKCYDELTAQKGKKLELSKRPLIESIYLIFNLGSEEAMQRGVSIQKLPDLQFESTFMTSWLISKYCWQGNFYRTLKLSKHLPVLLQGLIYAKHIQNWRRTITLQFSHAYNSPNCIVAQDFLLRVLLVDTVNLKSLALHGNIEKSPGETGDGFKFSKKSIPTDLSPQKPRKEIINFSFASI